MSREPLPLYRALVTDLIDLVFPLSGPATYPIAGISIEHAHLLHRRLRVVPVPNHDHSDTGILRLSVCRPPSCSSPLHHAGITERQVLNRAFSETPVGLNICLEKSTVLFCYFTPDRATSTRIDVRLKIARYFTTFPRHISRQGSLPSIFDILA